MAKTPTITKPDPVRAMLAWERYTDYVLMDAMEGTFDAETYARASAAFSMTDHEGMEKIADEAKREVDFIEAPDVFVKLDKPKRKDGSERDWTISERYAILRATEGTRAYARVKLDALTDDDPFS